MSERVVELVVFRTRPGIDEEVTKRAAAASMRFLEQQQGFLRRQLAVSEAGEWADIVEWTDMESAQRAAAAFMDAPEVQDFMAVLDPEQMTLWHLRRVLETGGVK